MEKNRIIPLIYGYAVCLVAIIVTLISVSMIVNAIFTLQDPIRSQTNGYYGPYNNLSSFEAYKVEVLTNRQPAVTADKELKPADSYIPTETELRASYESSRNDRIAGAQLEAKKSITSGIIMLLIALMLFSTHWTWLRRINTASAK